MRAFENMRFSGLYRSRQGLIFGVCKGLARHYDFSLFWVRFLTVLVALFTGVWPVALLYVAAALLMKPAPVIPLENDAEQEFYNSYSAGRTAAVGRLKRTFDGLERRLRRLEDSVTAREYDWQRRFNEGD
ncbi:phage shock protein C, PspC [Desulfarculus baarsii DSM 2075]|uniref:Phage shock protein C, PspC n=1 Tax=Desulfarculus baarsii (strain ATCC 33931 / DSM 2075 / LMG 7858 / VKM B-1802 / 2st14) TaxID=644282 RepID=E1QM72_DESB2|nr:envelope stress response membrane protein PspC [Desulfarculus baarsii]ADK86115.1 phage shock protein C, PspC [Desulfarculus baarsii DSM 2075]